jgi:hypothetical protein
LDTRGGGTRISKTIKFPWCYIADNSFLILFSFW